jgi:hypothetical protein
LPPPLLLLLLLPSHHHRVRHSLFCLYLHIHHVRINALLHFYGRSTPSNNRHSRQPPPNRPHPYISLLSAAPAIISVSSPPRPCSSSSLSPGSGTPHSQPANAPAPPPHPKVDPRRLAPLPHTRVRPPRARSL